MILRPVIEVIPSTTKVLEQSSLPLSWVLTPYGHSPELFETGSVNRMGAVVDDEESSLPMTANLLAKCTHCGAPINPCSPFLSALTILCGLCGKTYEIDFRTQYEARLCSESFIYSKKIACQRNIEDEENSYRIRYCGNTIPAECNRNIVEYSLPVVYSTNQNVTEKNMQPMYSLPVSACPPLLAVLIDGTSSDALYYSTIAQVLTKLIQSGSDTTEGMKGTRIGIFIMSRNGGISVFDMSSPVPHLKHTFVPSPTPDDSGITQYPMFSDYSYEAPFDGTPLAQFVDFGQVFVPLDSNYSVSCVESAIRALADYTTVINEACDRSSSRLSHDDDVLATDGVFLGSTIQVLLEFLDDIGAFHPGSEEPFINPSTVSQSILYAGGKIVCFLANTPVEIKSTEPRSQKGIVGRGGFGGSCAPVGKRFKSDSSRYVSSNHRYVPPSQQNFDVEIKGNIQLNQAKEMGDDEQFPTHRQSVGIEEYFQHIGIDCAKFAFGVEIFAIVLSEYGDESLETYIGLPVLRLLSDRSGGNGPIIFQLSKRDAKLYNPQVIEMLQSELISRSPWRRPHAFGAFLKIRFSPTLSVVKAKEHLLSGSNPTTHNSADSERLSEFYKSNGISGPVSASSTDVDLVVMGACDDFATVSFDVEISSTSRSVIESAKSDDWDSEPLNCAQVSFVYTAVVTIGKSYSVVRRLRLLTQRLSVSDDTEHLMTTCDPEALAVVLFHKLYYAALKYGLNEAQLDGRRWLLRALISLYKSASKAKHHEFFLSTDRLLNSDTGTMSNRDILLAQGHDRYQALPLLIFSLLQSDALRPSSGFFQPCSDARSAAAANMYNMSPATLARCIAPRIELWSLGSDFQDSPESVNMNKDSVQSAALELFSRNSYMPPILLLDSPRQILLSSCHDLVGISAREIPDTRCSEIVSETLRSYRVPPPVLIDLSGPVMSNNHLTDALIEDSKDSLTGMGFYQWCTDIAEIVYGNVV